MMMSAKQQIIELARKFLLVRFSRGDWKISSSWVALSGVPGLG